MPLDLSSLKKAINSFEIALNIYFSNEKTFSENDGLKKTLMAGVIQNFEFTYELCWKFMKRWLSNNLGRTYVDGTARRELFRLSIENKLIENINDWMEYHDARNETSHTYNENKAEEVFEIANKFINDAKYLLEKLESKND